MKHISAMPHRNPFQKSSRNDLHKEFTSSKEDPSPNGISECRSYTVSFIYAQIKELFLVYTEFLTTIFQEAHNLTGRCDAGIDICLSRLCTHLLRSREITSWEMIGKLIVMSRHDVGHILQVRTVIHQAKQICFVNHLLTGSIHQQTVFGIRFTKS